MTNSQVIGGNPTNFSDQTTPERVNGSSSLPDALAYAQWFQAVEGLAQRNHAAEAAANAIPHNTTISANMLRYREGNQVVTTTVESFNMLVNGKTKFESPQLPTTDESILASAHEQMLGEKDKNPYIAERKMAIRRNIAGIARASKQAVQQMEVPSEAQRQATEIVRTNDAAKNRLSGHAILEHLRNFGRYLNPNDAAHVLWTERRAQEKQKRDANPATAKGRRAAGAPNTKTAYGQETSAGHGAVQNAGG